MNSTKKKLKTLYQIISLGNSFYHTQNDLKVLIEDYFLTNYEDYSATGLLHYILEVAPDRDMQPTSQSKSQPKRKIDWKVVNTMTTYMVVVLLNFGSRTRFINETVTHQNYDDLECWLFIGQDNEYWEYWNGSIFTIAGEIGSLKLINHIYSQAYRPNLKEEAVIRAAVNGHHQLISYFIQNDLANLQSFGWEVFADALKGACVNGYIEVAKLLVNHDLYTTGGPKYNCYSALPSGARSGNLELCEFLVENIYNRYLDFDRAAECAAVEGHLHIIKYLESVGANIQNTNGVMAFACEFGHMNVVEYLVTKGVYMEPHFLVRAVRENHYDVAKFIMDKGVDLVEALKFSASRERKRITWYITRQLIKRNPERLYEAKEYLTDYQKTKYAHLLTMSEFNLM